MKIPFCKILSYLSISKKNIKVNKNVKCNSTHVHFFSEKVEQNFQTSIKHEANFPHRVRNNKKTLQKIDEMFVIITYDLHNNSSYKVVPIDNTMKRFPI